MRRKRNEEERLKRSKEETVKTRTGSAWQCGSPRGRVIRDVLDRAVWAVEVLQSHITMKLGRKKLTVSCTQNILSLQSSLC